ncbi:MAG: hypothetical protein KAS32_29620 [Candidatus Peribacteraceae bacterium]|nr:hypothetical protein [Candidatus Peribacteraceae bacterium]
MVNESNIAFIDGQNLYYGTRENEMYFDYLDKNELQNKIGYTKKRGP